MWPNFLTFSDARLVKTSIAEWMQSGAERQREPVDFILYGCIAAEGPAHLRRRLQLLWLIGVKLRPRWTHQHQTHTHTHTHPEMTDRSIQRTPTQLVSSVTTPVYVCVQVCESKHVAHYRSDSGSLTCISAV